MNLIEEFNKANVNHLSYDKSELFSYINSLLYDLEDEEKSLKEAVIYNYFYRIRDILIDFISCDLIDIDFYKEDYLLLKEMILLCKEYKKYLNIILKSDSNDFESLYRLGVVTNNNFRNNINYFESLRTNLTAVYSNVYFKDNRYSDNREEFKEFFKDMEKVYGKRY